LVFSDKKSVEPAKKVWNQQKKCGTSKKKCGTTYKTSWAVLQGEDGPIFVSNEGMVMNTIGDKVKVIRKKNNLNQIDFAETIGISQGRLSEIVGSYMRAVHG
jgi:predicted XRE-type DNA-binding protein